MSDLKAISRELEKLKSEKEVGSIVLSGARDKYASEINENGNINNMRMIASMKNKTYKKPKKLRRQQWLDRFVKKIRIVFGLDE